MKIFACLTLTIAAACTAQVDTQTSELGACASTIDCTAVGGGTCIDHRCHATNECSSTTVCPAATECVPSSVFGGLCTPPNAVPSPQPPVACNTVSDCPPNATACSAGHCVASTAVCISDADCPSTERCTTVCSSTGITTRVCRPAGEVSESCPIRCIADHDCSTAEHCVEVCATTGAVGHVCKPLDVPPTCPTAHP